VSCHCTVAVHTLELAAQQANRPLAAPSERAPQLSLAASHQHIASNSTSLIVLSLKVTCQAAMHRAAAYGTHSAGVVQAMVKFTQPQQPLHAPCPSQTLHMTTVTLTLIATLCCSGLGYGAPSALELCSAQAKPHICNHHSHHTQSLTAQSTPHTPSLSTLADMK
jgi:hypothetical protein